MAKTTPAKQLEARVLQGQQGSYLHNLLTFVHYEQGSSLVVARMPNQIEAFDEVWNVIQEEATRMGGLRVKREGKWPTAREIHELLGSVTWLWEKWIPVGFVTMLVGEPGSGKSFLGLDWVKHVLLKEPWPLTNKPLRFKNTCALWIETESSQQLVTSRCASMLIPSDFVYMPGFGEDLLGQPDLIVEAHRERIVQAVNDLRPNIIIVDSLGGAHSGGENKVEEVRPMLDFLARLSRDHKLPTIAVHHLRKRSAGETIEISMDRVRGSSAFSAFARSIIAVDRTGENHNIRVIKANLSEKPQPLNFEVTFNEKHEPTGVSYTEFVPPARKRTKVERCAQWLLDQLRDKPTGLPLLRLQELGEPEGYPRGMLYRAKDTLGQAITVTGDGRKAHWVLSNGNELDELCEQLSEGEN